jgi:hypothetical protein
MNKISARQKAARDGLAKSGRDEIGDAAALDELVYLICKGYGLRAASRKAAKFAPNPAGISDEHIAARLRAKIRKKEIKEPSMIMAQVLLTLERKHGKRLPGCSVLSYIKIILDAERKHGGELSPGFLTLIRFLRV